MKHKTESIPQMIARLERRRRQLDRLAKVQLAVNELESRTGLCVVDGAIIGPARLLVAAASAYYHVSSALITSRSREYAVVIPRHVVFYLLRKLIGARYAAIGRVFKRDHGTVLGGVKSVENQVQTNPRFAAEVTAIEKQCRDLLSQHN
jgi:hypothetical protein